MNERELGIVGFIGDARKGLTPDRFQGRWSW